MTRSWASIVVAFVGPMALYLWALGTSWRRFKVADDLRHADDGYRFPDGDSTGGLV